MRISDWSSDVCSSDLLARRQVVVTVGRPVQADRRGEFVAGNLLGVAQGVAGALADQAGRAQRRQVIGAQSLGLAGGMEGIAEAGEADDARPAFPRSEEHTSELQSLMRTSYAVFCLKQK